MMKKLFLILVACICVWLGSGLQKPAQANETLSSIINSKGSQSIPGEHWITSYGGVSNNSITAIIQTADAGFVAAGYTESFSDGIQELWVLKLNPEGGIIWQKAYGGLHGQTAVFVGEIGNGDLYVVGTTHSHGMIWILRLSADGNIIWQKNYGDYYYTEPMAVRLIGDENLMIVSNRGVEISILKLSLLDGSIFWQKNTPVPCCPTEKIVSSFALTGDGGAMVVGIEIQNDLNITGWVMRLDADGNSLWYHTYGQESPIGFADIEATEDSAFLAVGTKGNISGGRNTIILKLDGDGNIIWQKTFITTGDDIFNINSDIQATQDGNFIVIHENETHIRIMKITPNGELLWQNQYAKWFSNSGSAGINQFQVIEASNGDIVVAGDKIYSDVTGFDALVMKLDLDGEVTPCQWIEPTTTVVSDTQFIIGSPVVTSPLTDMFPYTETTIVSSDTFFQPQYICQEGIQKAAEPIIAQIFTASGLPEVIFVTLSDPTGQTLLSPRYTLSGGETWLFQPQYNPTYSLAGIIPKDNPQYPLRLFANNGVYRSGDFGLTWAYTEVNAYEFDISPKDPQRMYSTWNYWGGTGGSCWPFPCDALFGVINQSTDGGVTWSSITVKWETYSQFVLSPIQATDGYYRVGSGGDSVVRRMVTGVEFSFPVASFVLDAEDTERIYGVDDYFTTGHTSSDAGQTWTPWASFPLSSCVQLMAHPTLANTLYLRCQAGLFRSADGGNIWGQITTVQGDALAPHLGIAGQILWSHDGCLYASGDNGDTWNELNCFSLYWDKLYLPIMAR